jgi:hypothetical protein
MQSRRGTAVSPLASKPAADAIALLREGRILRPSNTGVNDQFCNRRCDCVRASELTDLRRQALVASRQ